MTKGEEAIKALAKEIVAHVSEAHSGNMENLTSCATCIKLRAKVAAVLEQSIPAVPEHLAKKLMAHDTEAHSGDGEFHASCSTCRQLAQAMFDHHGIMPEELLLTPNLKDSVRNIAITLSGNRPTHIQPSNGLVH